jgi:hypothetical protein
MFDPPPEIASDTRLKNLHALVEVGTSYERRMLWREHSADASLSGVSSGLMLTWEQDLNGWGVQVGIFAGEPVHIGLEFARINGKMIGIYGPISATVHHSMINAWVEKYTSTADGHRVPRTDAENFAELFLTSFS